MLQRKIQQGRREGKVGHVAMLHRMVKKIPRCNTVCDQREKYVKKLAIRELKEVCSGREE